MIINEQKTKALLIGGSKKLTGTTENLQLHINNQDIETTECEKLLGVYIDSSLSWANHVKHVKSIVQNRVNLLKYLKQHLPTEARKVFYSAYILPHFDFCSVVWNNATMGRLQDLVKLQKRAARIILDKKYDTPSSELFKKLNWLPLLDRFKYNRCTEVFKAIHEGCPQYMSNMFSKSTTNLRSSSGNKLFIPRTNKKCFSYFGAVTWNNLPENLRSMDSLPHFKKELKAHLLLNPT